MNNVHWRRIVFKSWLKENPDRLKECIDVLGKENKHILTLNQIFLSILLQEASVSKNYKGIVMISVQRIKDYWESLAFFIKPTNMNLPGLFSSFLRKMNMKYELCLYDGLNDDYYFKIDWKSWIKNQS